MLFWISILVWIMDALLSYSGSIHQFPECDCILNYAFQPFSGSRSNTLAVEPLHVRAERTHKHTCTPTLSPPLVWHAYFIDNLSLQSQLRTRGGILVKSRIDPVNIFFLFAKKCAWVVVNSLSVNAAVLFYHEQRHGAHLPADAPFRPWHTAGLGNDKTD